LPARLWQQQQLLLLLLLLSWPPPQLLSTLRTPLHLPHLPLLLLLLLLLLASETIPAETAARTSLGSSAAWNRVSGWIGGNQSFLSMAPK
jgi:hypothetical protein